MAILVPAFLTDLDNCGDLGLRHHFRPAKRPIIKGLQDAARQFPKMPKRRKHSGSKSRVVHDSDCFSILPLEIRVQIATYLRTADFLRLRQSSRAMAVVFGIESFWKSRFSQNGDRGFLNCLAENPRKRESKNWRLIYRCTARIDRCDEHLWATRRRWRNNRWLIERCSMIRTSDEHIVSNQGLLNELCWKEVSTEFRCDRDSRPENRHGGKENECRICWAEHKLFSQVVLLESSINGLAVSIQREGAETYITGFDLLNADPERPNVLLGYRLPGGSVTLNFYGEQLIGFTVIEGQGGIHAIRPIFNENTIPTSWIGIPEGFGICKPTELVLERNIKAISGKFDVSHSYPGKMCSIR